MGEWERGAWPGGSGQCVCRIWAAWGSNRDGGGMGEWERGAWPGGSGQCVCRIWAVWGDQIERRRRHGRMGEGHGLVDLGSAYVGFGRRGDQIERRRRHGRMGERGMAWWIWAVRMSDLGGVGSNRETAAAW
ncbi:unnamed protein product [Prunus armeniaca]|uniref:Uncharacterized protein n=1 Tax=Prunus armeniaca TaxID=36596 RepID=A0A6J5TMG2_PRUAR|nr:unnamed protein product [Prunus armeniaca]